MAKAKKSTVNGTETLDIPHEIVTQQTSAPAPATLEDEVKREIAKFGLADSRIAELKKRYIDLQISDLNDRKAYETVRDARGVVKSLRTGIEKKRKELKAFYLETGKAIDAEAGRLTDLLLEIEVPLDEQIKRIDAEKDRLRREAEEKEAAALHGRVNSLISAGMAFNGSFYAIGETLSIDAVTLKNMPDDVFENRLKRVQIEQFAIQEKASAERLRIEVERLEFERLQKEQKEQAAELERQQKQQEQERQQFLKDRHQMRAEQLEVLNIHYKPSIKGWAFSNVIIGENQLATLETEVWQNHLAIAKEVFLEQKEQEAKQKEADERNQARRTELFNLGFKFLNGTFFIVTETYGESNLYNDEVLAYDEQAWNTFIKVATAAAQETRRQDLEQRDRKATRETRQIILEQYGFKFSFNNGGEWVMPGHTQIIFPDAAIDEDAEQWLKDLKVFEQGKAFNDAKAQQEKEAERLARLSDVEKVKEFLTGVSDAMWSAPKTEDSRVTSLLGAFLNSVSEAHTSLENALNSL